MSRVAVSLTVFRLQTGIPSSFNSSIYVGSGNSASSDVCPSCPNSLIRSCTSLCIDVSSFPSASRNRGKPGMVVVVATFPGSASGCCATHSGSNDTRRSLISGWRITNSSATFSGLWVWQIASGLRRSLRIAAHHRSRCGAPLSLPPPPGESTHWTGRELAKAAGVGSSRSLHGLPIPSGNISIVASESTPPENADAADSAARRAKCL